MFFFFRLIRRFEIEWIGRDGLSPDTHEKYLNEFVNHFYKSVMKLVDRGMRKERLISQDESLIEIISHLHLCRRSNYLFLGRETEISVLQRYLSGSSRDPFLVFGEPGAGKTAFISRVYAGIQSKLFFR